MKSALDLKRLIKKGKIMKDKQTAKKLGAYPSNVQQVIDNSDTGITRDGRPEYGSGIPLRVSYVEIDGVIYEMYEHIPYTQNVGAFRNRHKHYTDRT